MHAKARESRCCRAKIFVTLGLVGVLLEGAFLRKSQTMSERSNRLMSGKFWNIVEHIPY